MPVNQQHRYLFFTKWMVLLGFLLTQGCSTSEEAVPHEPAKAIYFKAMASYEDETLKEAEKRFQQVIAQNPGTKLATMSYLKLGDLQFTNQEWEKSETNYRSFLTFNPKSHLTPYVLSQLIALNYERNVHGIFVKSRDFERDMEPNRKIIQEYQRFFFLYANNAYLADTKKYLRLAKNDLAEHELMVANFYFENKSYNSAILRYLHLLKTYPAYSRTKEAGLRLIEAYKENKQPHLATEMQQAIEVRFSQNTQP
ncbi:MAG: outer membrane protein assembly factor BamD [SAR324 cluster bacterium]|nr:outer membrane protein assembly factor BamD [SAR324 cluster bacterium]